KFRDFFLNHIIKFHTLDTANLIVMITTLYFEFGEVRVFKNFVLVVMKEGTTVKPEHNDHLEEIAIKYYAGRKFGYITFRKNSYAVNPLVYLKTSKIKNLA